MKPTLALLTALLLIPLVGGATCYAAAGGNAINDRIMVKTPLRRTQAAAAEAPPLKLIVRDLTPLHDATRVLINPHKGWYHHFPDNHPNKYQIARDADLLEFPGMDHLYIRLAWAYLEPKEGQFDWGVIDRIIEKWTAHEWLADNPELTRELLNRCGYWLFPMSVELPEKAVAGTKLPFVLTLENRGVAPPYRPYALKVKLSGTGGAWVHTVAKTEKSWLPGAPIILRAELPLPARLKPGGHELSVGLFDTSSGQERPVELALQAATRDTNAFYRVAPLTMSEDASTQ